MYISFNFHGSTYRADLAKQDDNKIVVLFDDEGLEKQFGSLPFYIQDHSVEFNTLNPCHSDLYALNSTVSKAISEQCKDIL
jgi:hypothetical protein